MAAGQAEGLLGVVCEIRLRVLVGQVSDDLDRGLVRADGAVAAQSVEHARGGAGRLGGDVLVNLEAGVGHIVLDADGEAVEAIVLEVLVDREDHGGREVLAGEAVAAADDGDGRVVDSDLNIHVEGFADGAGLLGAVEDRDALHALREGRQELVRVEGAVEADLDEAVLGAAGRVQVVDCLLDGLAGGTHCDDDIGGVGGADVVEEVV